MIGGSADIRLLGLSIFNISPDFFKNSIPMLYDPQVGGLQGRVRLYNRNKNLLTALQEDEFAVISHLYQLGKELVGGLTALGVKNAYPITT